MMNIDTCSLLYVTKVREKVNDVFNNVVVMYYGVCSFILMFCFYYSLKLVEKIFWDGCGV